jgi:signal transduction histidine kinase/DNA-binding response OmpR family regulator
VTTGFIRWAGQARWRYVAGFIICNLLSASLLLAWLQYSRARYDDEASARAQNLAHLLEATVTSTITAIDRSLNSLSSEISLCQGGDQIACPDLARKIAIHGQSLDEVLAIFFASPQGMITTGFSNFEAYQPRLVDISERDYFRAIVANPHQGLVISKPVIGKITKRWSVLLARAVLDQHGKLTGVLAASLDLEYLQSMLLGVDVGTHGTLMLRDANLATIARHPRPLDLGAEVGTTKVSPELKQLVDEGKVEAVFRSPSPFDGVLRLIAFKKSASYPVYVNIGLAADDYLARWQSEVTMCTVLWLIGVLLSAFTLRQLYVQHVWQETQIETLERSRRELASVQVTLLGDIKDRERIAGDLAQHQAHLEEIVEQRTKDLVEAKTAAESANRAKSAFLANMSHEIRTPLNAITGLTHLIRKNATDPRQAEQLDRVADGARHLLGIINNVLDFSKIEAGRLELVPGDFSVEAVMRDVCSIVSEQAHERGLELVIDTWNIPAWLHGDGMRLGQIIVNFAINAVKFTRHGHVLVRANRTYETATEIGLRFEVCDTGAGIPAEIQERLFQPFEQADASTTRRFGGTGLGLAISHRLASLMGGTVGLKSTPGQGSIFWIETPFGKVADPPAQDTPASPRKVLVVDSLDAVRTSLAKLLRKQGHDVQCASNAAEAIIALREADHSGQAFGVVLVKTAIADASFDETRASLMQGLHALALSQAPRIVLLADAEQADGDPMTDMPQFGGVLVKPILPSALQQRLANSSSPYVASLRQPKVSEAERQLIALRGARILLAEDNMINREVAVEMLRNVNLEVEVAENGLEAVRMARAGSFDLILMDVQMPELDGIEATRRIREMPGYELVPILSMTANAFDEDRKACLAAGMNDHVAKPVDSQTLYTTLAHWLGN